MLDIFFLFPGFVKPTPAFAIIRWASHFRLLLGFLVRANRELPKDQTEEAQ